MNPIVLGDVAEKLAVKKFVGETSDADFMEMLKYYPENDPVEFINCWCAAFVYHCCREAGMNLPLGTNRTSRKGKFRWFTSAIAWVEWAQVCGFLHEAKDFAPGRGDIVIYNNIIPVENKQKDSLWCDHLGIVLSCEEDSLTVAEGNVNNQNVSGIVIRTRDETIGRFIRIPENNIYDNWQIDPDDDSVELSFREMRNTMEGKAQLLEWLSNPSVVEWAWKENEPWDMKKIEEHFISKTFDNSDVIPCFIEMNGEAIGYVQYYPVREDSYLFTPQLSFEQFEGGYGMDLMIGYPGLWNKGIGTRVVRMVADYLIHDKDAKLVCADPEENNLRSIACWEKAGFVPVGLIPNYDEPEKRSVFMVYKEMKIIQIKENKKDFLDLLLLADEQENMIDKYLDRGEMFALYDGDLKSICVVTKESDDTVELKNLATYIKYQGQGYGSTLISFIFDYYKDKCKTMFVGTGDSPLTVPFYERCGFTFSHRLKNFILDNYDKPIIENGVQLFDMVYLKKDF